MVEISSSSPHSRLNNVTGKVLHTPEKQQNRVVFCHGGKMSGLQVLFRIYFVNAVCS